MGKDKHKRHKPLAEDVSQPYVVSRPSKRRKERESKRKDSDDEVFSVRICADLQSMQYRYYTYWMCIYYSTSVCTIGQVA